MQVHITHIGTATALLEIAGLRILTDPVLGGARRAHFGWGMCSRHLREEVLEPASLGPIDLVLLSHHQHEDNLDPEGRLFLEGVSVLTTEAAARVLSGQGGPMRGLAPFEAVDFPTSSGTLRVSATPARHGPPLSLPIVGPVVGFVLEHPKLEDGAIWVSGDTVRFGGVFEIARRFDIGTALLHLGAASYGPLRFTMDAREGARVTQDVGAQRAIPLHYEGWTHFREEADAIEPAFVEAGIADRLLRLPLGERVRLEL